ncbi:restriction endonuclease subunit S [Sinorhizobium meliloti]|nr:restriction endonuclease subunit S [Sinorhizobium meliloti]
MRTEKLGNLAEFRNGLNYTDADNGSGLAVIGVSDFQDKVVIDTSKLPQLSLSVLSKPDALIREGDILFVRSNGNRELIGRSVYVNAEPAMPTSHSGFTIRCRFHDRRCYPRFYAYLFRGSLIRQILSAQGGGTNISNLNQQILADLDVPVPNFSMQERIAGTLSAYDDLIEVNQQRIAILVDIARRLFDEWFVRFRFPGHEAVPLVETELGMVPEGWKPGTISDLSSFISRGLTPRYDDEASSLVINQKCIRDQALNMSPARKQSKPIPQSKLVIDGDILINSTGVGTLGRVAQLLGTLPNATVDTHVTIVRAEEQVDLHYFGLQLLQLQPHFERQGTGATGQTELSRAAIADTKIHIPPLDLASRFGRIAGPLRCQAELLRNQNNKLRAARDLLLPKLVSGEIDVSTAEQTFAEAAE